MLIVLVAGNAYHQYDTNLFDKELEHSMIMIIIISFIWNIFYFVLQSKCSLKIGNWYSVSIRQVAVDGTYNFIIVSEVCQNRVFVVTWALVYESCAFLLAMLTHFWFSLIA